MEGVYHSSRRPARSTPTSCEHSYHSQSDQVAHLIQQSQLYDLVRYLKLSKQRAELTVSRLQK